LTTSHDDQPGPILEALTRLIACDDLPETLPHDPIPLLVEWFEDARRCEHDDDFNAMTLATATANGEPSARIVLCKAIETAPPALVFYTSYASRKGEELAANPRAAAVFYWPRAKRQARIEGHVERTTEAESDAYYRSRPLLSRIGASVSPQSQAIASRASVVAEAMRLGRRAVLGLDVQRPSHWGGFRILPNRIELWSASSGRLHDRAVWTRDDCAQEHNWLAQRLGA